MAHKFTVALHAASLNAATKQLQAYKRDTLARVRLLAERLTEQGAEVAHTKVVAVDAVMFGRLAGSIEGVFDPATGIGLIVAGAPHAVFVEFGTGIAGQNSPHPMPDGWRYDVNAHEEAGWWYWGDWDNNWHGTRGMPSRPFMWETARELPQLLQRIAKEVFG